MDELVKSDSCDKKKEICLKDCLSRDGWTIEERFLNFLAMQNQPEQPQVVYPVSHSIFSKPKFAENAIKRKPDPSPELSPRNGS